MTGENPGGNVPGAHCTVLPECVARDVEAAEGELISPSADLKELHNAARPARTNGMLR
ncbi:hypothetical protein [Cupriavidus sp. TMH.W2]|uniref:hypothetical protein n=1 Tax=Cupriavidus sp. TMH.W2 TaxID=3434465 RepID=UPI003D76ACDD